MAADSKPFSRGAEPSIFKGCLGVCLGFSKPEEFHRVYDDGIKAIFSDIPDKRTRNVLKSYDLRQLFKEDNDGYV